MLKRLAVYTLAVLALSSAASTRQAPADAPFFFLQFSDPQFGMFSADKDFAQETANFEFAVASANRLKPAFVVVTGDLVNKAGDAAQIAEYRRIAAKLDRAIPLYNVAGNHDVGNAPTPATVAAYTTSFGPDHYSFTRGTFTGIVLDSSLIKSPATAGALLAEQETWTKDEFAKAQRAGARHVVVFQHHPYFLKTADEAEGYYNLPQPRRAEYLALFHGAGVSAIIAGHFHNNSPARDGNLEMITTGPVGKPQGTGARSGIRVVIVRATGLEHRFYEFSEIPNSIDPAKTPTSGTSQTSRRTASSVRR